MHSASRPEREYEMKKSQPTDNGGAAGDLPPTLPHSSAEDTTTDGFTGRYLVLFREDAVNAGIAALNESAGLRSLRAADFDMAAMSAETLPDTDAVILEHLGVAVVSGAPEQVRSLRIAADETSPILA